MKTIDPAQLGARAFYRYMTAAVAPRPIAFASTVDAAGNVNLSPFSFFNFMGIDPPILVFAPNRRGRDHSHKDTALNLFEVPELVINMVNYDMVQQMSLSSAEFERGVNEFAKAGFTMLPSEVVKPDESGQIDQTRTDWVARMGGDWYARASGDAMFEVPRPQYGIGVDALPESVRTSKILTGNNLGQLGSLMQYPSTEQIEDFGKTEMMRSLREEAGLGCQYFPDLLHIHARRLLEEGKISEALLTLLQES